MADFDIDKKFLNKLIEAFKDADLTELKFETEQATIKLKREPAPVIQAAAAPVAAAPVAAAAPAAAPVVSADAPAAAPDYSNAIKSPMVGTAYLSPEPGKPVFVSVGDSVAEGDTLLIIEAMKVMNPLKSPKGGTVKEILAEDGMPVEFDQPLIVIE